MSHLISVKGIINHITIKAAAQNELEKKNIERALESN